MHDCGHTARAADFNISYNIYCTFTYLEQIPQLSSRIMCEYTGV